MADDHDSSISSASTNSSHSSSNQAPTRPTHYNASRSNDPTLQGATAHNRYFPRSSTGMGTPLPWLDRHLRLTMDRDKSYHNMEESSSEVSTGDKFKSKWIWIILAIVLILVIVVVGTILIVVLALPDDENEPVQEEEMETVENSFLTTYDASITLLNADFTDDLNDPNSPRSLQFTQQSCGMVDDMFVSTVGYAGCEGQGFSPGSVIFGFKLKILYEVSISVALNTPVEERINAVFAAFVELRNTFEPTLRTTLIREVNANVNLGNAQINTEPGAGDIQLVDTTRNLCVPNPCVTGVCGRLFTNNINTGYNCLCPDTHTGLQCQILVNQPTLAVDTEPPIPEETTQPLPVNMTTQPMDTEPEKNTQSQKSEETTKQSAVDATTSPRQDETTATSLPVDVTTQPQNPEETTPTFTEVTEVVSENAV